MRLARLPASTALATVLMQPAWAQVTAEDVWALSSDFYAATGLTVSAEQTRAGNTLTLSNITLSVDLPEGLGQIAVIGGSVDLVDQGDGTVAIQYPAQTEVRIAGVVGPAGETVSFEAVLQGTQAATIVVSGTPADFTVTAESGPASVSLTDLTLSGFPEAEAITTDTIGLSYDVESSQSVTRYTREGGLLTMESQSAVGLATYQVSFNFAGDFAMRSDTTGATAASQSLFTLSLPEGGVDYMNLGASLRAGLAMDLVTQASGISSINETMTEFDGITSQTSETATSTGTVTLGQDGLSMTGRTSDAQLTYNAPDMVPFPMSFSMASAEGALTAPLLAMGGTQPARLLFSVGGLDIDPQLVRLLDPSELLPREPISMALDLSAEVRLLSDLVDFVTMGQLIETGTPPATVDSVTLDRLSVSAAGADIDASGSFLLDFDDMTSFDGFPRPEGQASARATGVNGLLDTLVAMGLLGDSDVMAARMGLGMFTRNMGDDMLESSLEVTPDGQVLVNGNRMR